MTEPQGLVDKQCKDESELCTNVTPGANKYLSERRPKQSSWRCPPEH